MDVQAPTKVLIVDDAIGDVILLRALIEEDDHHHVQIDHAGSMDEAFALLQNGTPDIILLDLGLPDSRGLRSVELMLQADADSAIVVLTGLDDEAIAIEAVKMGVQDYWHKDELDSRTVVRGIRYAIERHHAKRELRETQRQLLHAQKMDALGRLAGGWRTTSTTCSWPSSATPSCSTKISQIRIRTSSSTISSAPAIAASS